jgi:general secretion pathway protein A
MDRQGIRRITPMFLDFFGLQEQPFGMTPDPAYLYASRTHSQALAALSLGIVENRGFFALIAEPGMGKTMLLYQLLDDLRDTSRTVLLSQTQCNSREFIEYILQGLGVETKGMGLVAMHGQLNEILFEELLAGKRFVLIVDEAQNLDDSVLETVRMLSNFETHNTKLLQIILAGQPRLAAKLAQPGMSQLRQRVALLSHLEPFTVEETGLYIKHRLKVAGYSGEPIFDAFSVRLIARKGDGIPRNINNLCYTSLQLASARGLRTVTAEIVHEAVKRLDVGSLAFEPPAIAGTVAAPVAPVVPVAAAPIAAAAAAGVSGARLAAIPAPNNKAPNNNGAPSKGYLTYDADKKIALVKWPARSAILVAVLLSGTLLLAILGRSESNQAMAAAIFHRASHALVTPARADQSAATATSYDAAPQDTESGQVLTVMAGAGQTLRELSLRYVGHFDDDLSKKIFSLNPDLKDPDHLEVGQLIRIPLPPGAMRKVNDTAETPSPSEPETSGSLIAKLTALLRERK